MFSGFKVNYSPAFFIYYYFCYYKIVWKEKLEIMKWIGVDVSWKKVFLEISQNSQENTCARVNTSSQQLYSKKRRLFYRTPLDKCLTIRVLEFLFSFCLFPKWFDFMTFLFSFLSFISIVLVKLQTIFW